MKRQNLISLLVLERLDGNFKLRKKYLKMATKTIEKRKKTKKEKDIFVCVHVRRTDRINFEKAHGLKPLKGKGDMKFRTLFKSGIEATVFAR